MTTAPAQLADAPHVAIIGAGVIGTAIVTALRVAGWPEDRISVSTRSEERAASVRESHGVAVEQDSAAVVKGASVVVLAVKPQDMSVALDQITGHLKEGVL